MIYCNDEQGDEAEVYYGANMDKNHSDTALSEVMLVLPMIADELTKF